MKSIFFLIILFPILVFASEIKPFTTDGCSAFPDGTIEQQSLWVNCCIRHDLAYWKGGTYEERLNADKQLEACVTNVGEPEIAKLMMAGVRAGGSPFFPTTYRWGYGWPYMRGYKALTKEEKDEVSKRLMSFKKMIDNVYDEIKR